MRELYCKNGEGFVFTYSVTSRNTFELISSYRDDVIKFRKGKPFASILVGNKDDLGEQREVVTDEGRELAESWGSPFFETSAKTESNVDEMFYQCIREIRKLNI